MTIARHDDSAVAIPRSELSSWDVYECRACRGYAAHAAGRDRRGDYQQTEAIQQEAGMTSIVGDVRQAQCGAPSLRADDRTGCPAGRRILVVDDETSLLRTLGARLRRQGYGVTFATTGREALAQAARCRADAVILDLSLPDINGMEVLAGVRCWTTAPIIVLSACTTEIQKVAALDAGANDYVTKPFGMEELMARLRAALRDVRRGCDEPVVETEHFTIDLLTQRVLRSGVTVPLTPTEWRIVQLLARNPGHLITHRQLLWEIWGLEEVPNNYMRVFLVTIRRKLEPNPARPIYFVTEPGCGVRFLPSGGPPTRAAVPASVVESE
jgi:two-component system, OmpR family, KDP operon response regulator KdpE